MKSVEDKFTTVIQKNTFYFINQKFEEDYEGYMTPKEKFKQLTNLDYNAVALSA